MKNLGHILNRNYKSKNLSYSGNKHSHNDKNAETFDFLDLVKSWGAIIGPTLSKVTVPLKIRAKSLTILTAHPAFSQQLSQMEEQIKKNIFSKYPNLSPKIKRIYFQTSPNHFNQEKKPSANFDPDSYKKSNKLNPHSPTYKKLLSESEELFSEISDEELKKSLTSIFIQLKSD